MDKWLTRIEIALICLGATVLTTGIVTGNEVTTATGMGIAIISIWSYLDNI